MPSQTQGFNENGESTWFDSGKLPVGWTYEDPTIKKESVPEAPKEKPEDCCKPEAKPEAKGKAKKKAESRAHEAAE